MAYTQEEINAFVEAEMQERALQAKINGIETIIPADLEKELDAEVSAAHAAYQAVYQDHSKMTREEYRKAADPRITTWKTLRDQNIAIKARNATKTLDVNAPILAEKAALETKAASVVEANEAIFKEIVIKEAAAVVEKAG